MHYFSNSCSLDKLLRTRWSCSLSWRTRTTLRISWYCRSCLTTRW
ncbi:hypothetical protein FGIG_12449 [Fasciola gigantica]|uniref:Uncharacterized protein n=1 Tax=Fasciola gigantica TaxID=46835 RepID=A0A504Y8G4_FASGI|nr:hypothetical protein FGIG_12449 [Fasciola gigantica]